MERAPRLALIALLLVALPVASVGLSSAALGVDDSPPTSVDAPSHDLADARTDARAGSTGSSSADRTPPADRSSASAQSAANGNGTLNRLGLESGDVTSSYGTPGPDLTGMVATGDGQLEASYQLYYYQYRLENAANDTQRERYLDEALSYSETRLERLRNQEAAAIRSYHNGSASTRDLLRELARIDAEAEAVRNALDELKGYANDRRRVGDLQRGFESLEGPIRGHVRNSLAGEGDEVFVHVTTTRNGLVVEMVDDGEYLREAVRLDHRKPGGDLVPFNLVERMSEFYPSTFDPDGGTVPESYGKSPTNDVQLLLVEFVVPQGSVTTYYDTGTEELYRETQRLRTDRLQTRTVVTGRDSDVEVTVNRTEEGNPIRINVTENGDPVDATIRIDGQRVGRTGADGVLWTLGTPGEYTVSALTYRETTNVTVPAGSGQLADGQ